MCLAEGFEIVCPKLDGTSIGFVASVRGECLLVRFFLIYLPMVFGFHVEIIGLQTCTNTLKMYPKWEGSTPLVIKNKSYTFFFFFLNMVINGREQRFGR